MKNPISCQICGRECSCNGLHHHVTRGHKISWEDYKKQYNVFQRYDPDSLSAVELVDFVVCKICGQRMAHLARHLVFKHNLHADEYKRRFPEAETVSTKMKDVRRSLMAGINTDITDEHRAQRRESGRANLIAYNKSPEHIATAIVTNSTRWDDPEFRARTIANMFDGDFGKRTSPYTCPDGTVVKMRSSYETNFAKILDSLGLRWAYESKRFPYTLGEKTRVYLPDFYIPALKLFVEVKANFWYQTYRAEVEAKLSAVRCAGCEIFLLTEDTLADFISMLEGVARKQNVA